MDEEVDESDEPALMCELYRCKNAPIWTLTEYYELGVCLHNIGNNQETSGLLSRFYILQYTKNALIISNASQ